MRQVPSPVSADMSPSGVAPLRHATPSGRVPGLDRRTALALDLSSWIVLVVMGVLGMTALDGTGPRIVAAVLCAAYGGLDLLGGRSDRAARHPVLIFAAQTIVVAGLLSLHPRFQDTFAFLFVMLSIRVVLVLGLRVGAWWIGLFWVLSSVAAVWTHGREGFFNVVFNLGVYPLCGMVGYALAALARSTTERAAALAQLRRAQDQLRRVAVDEERRRLGRDLHDSVKQQVFAATMQLGAAKALLPAHPQRALGAIERAEQAARSAGSELNVVIHELRSADLDHGLPTALGELATQWSRQLGTTIVQDIDERIQVPVATGFALIRVAQEALANVGRHAEAAQVRLTLSGSAAGIDLTITDDGRGFDPDQGGNGVGVNSMQERLAALGGELRVTSAPGDGTAISAHLPPVDDNHRSRS